MKTYHGSCHCQAVTFEVDAEFTEGMKCNCSYCKRKGMLLAFVPASQVRILSGEDTLTTYLFNKMVINHKFCPTCGVQPFGQAGETMAINLNTITDEDFDLETLTINKVNGKDF